MLRLLFLLYTAAAISALALDEAALAKKMASMSKGRGRKKARAAPTAAPAAAAAAAVSPLPSAGDTLPGKLSSEVPIWPVPEDLRMPGADECESHGRHYSLDELFPNSGLADAWHTNAELRTDLRAALREDLFAPTLPEKWSDKQRSFALDLGSACMVAWGGAARGEMGVDAFSKAFAKHGIDLSGRDFLLGVSGLCGSNPHGSLIDIIPLNRRVAHSWHQDSGISSMTVLLGFPPRDGYEGGGVFSHHVKLSHPLRPSQGETHGAVVEYERLSDSPIPEEYVLRPLYGRGREIWVSDDAAHLHSTPDVQLRECLWRFM